MSGEKKEQSTEEIIAEMQELMKRQMELQNKLLNSNWGNFNDALGAFMDIFKGVGTPAQTQAKNKEPDSDEESG